MPASTRRAEAVHCPAMPKNRATIAAYELLTRLETELRLEQLDTAEPDDTIDPEVTAQIADLEAQIAAEKKKPTASDKPRK